MNANNKLLANGIISVDSEYGVDDVEAVEAMDIIIQRTKSTIADFQYLMDISVTQ
jgi:hypothetical protein